MIEDLLGKWLQVTEKVTYGDGSAGKYILTIQAVGTNETLMEYTMPSFECGRLMPSLCVLNGEYIAA